MHPRPSATELYPFPGSYVGLINTVLALQGIQRAGDECDKEDRICGGGLRP